LQPAVEISIAECSEWDKASKMLFLCGVLVAAWRVVDVPCDNPAVSKPLSMAAL
jgi:hypothetical protein